MKQKIITLCILGIAGVVTFIIVAAIFISPFSPLSFVPLWFSVLLILVLFIAETVGVIKWIKIENRGFKSYFTYYFLGLLTAGLFLFIRDYIPTLDFRNLLIKQEQSISEGRSDIFSDIVLGKPIFFAEKNFKNTHFDEYYFYVDIPITVFKNFTDTQILNAFDLNFLSQENGSMPAISGCETGMGYMFSVQNLSDDILHKPDTYTIRFKYSYYSGTECNQSNIISLIGEKITLTIVDSKDLETFTIDNIELK